MKQTVGFFGGWVGGGGRGGIILFMTYGTLEALH